LPTNNEEWNATAAQLGYSSAEEIPIFKKTNNGKYSSASAIKYNITKILDFNNQAVHDFFEKSYNNTNAGFYGDFLELLKSAGVYAIKDKYRD
jgi:hypothetical protein